MSSLTTFKLPDVGEGLTEAEVVGWHVAVGDRVEVNQVLVDIETAKSVVELPSPVAGVVDTLHVAEGETVLVGTVLISFREDGVATEPATVEPATVEPATVEPATVEPATVEPATVEPATVEPAPEARQDYAPTDAAPAEEPEEAPLILVGTGPTKAVARRRRLRSRERRAAVPARTGAVASGGRVSAKPPVRFLAKSLGVDLAAVVPGGDEITRSDVEAHAARHAGETMTVVAAASETRVPIKGVRKVTAAAMTASAFTAPHVTEFLTVDVTATMDLVRRLKADRRWDGVRVTPLLLVAKALILAAREYPEINAHWDEAAQEIVIHHELNLGIAAATPRGLLVPNIKAAGDLDLRELAVRLDELVATARGGRTLPADMARGTITLTNIGALGVDAGTPILNPGEAAILAFGAVRDMPWVVDGEVVVRQVTQLAISFDHRLVDGELGSHVLAHVGRLLNDPALAMTHA